MNIPKFYSNFRLREIVEEYIHSERDRKILIRKYCDKRTISQLADEFYLSETRIKTIISDGAMIIFTIMEKEKPKDPPTANNFFNVTSTAIITVPKGCCFTVAIENTSGPAAPGGVAPEILVQNANLTVSRIS